MTPLLQTMWVRRYPNSVRIVGGKMGVDLGPELCVLDMPRTVGHRLIRTGQWDRRSLAVYQHAARQWHVFAEPDVLDWQLVHDARQAGVVCVDTGTLVLDVPSTDSPHWIFDLEPARPLPRCAAVMREAARLSPVSA